MKLRSLSRLLPALALLGAPACALDASEPEPNEPDALSPAAPEPIGEATSALTLQEAINAGCSTSTVKGLSQQIIDQAECFATGSYVLMPPKPNLAFNDVELQYLQLAARDALIAVLAAKPGTTLTVNSMLRTLPQQYLLYTWYLNNQCNISLAAPPGASNHESGLALDVNQYATWKPTFLANGFTWQGASDPVHFDYTAPASCPSRATTSAPSSSSGTRTTRATSSSRTASTARKRARASPNRPQPASRSARAAR
jgi:D-alanyl-D-alanine carboxypeptidase